MYMERLLFSRKYPVMYLELKGIAITLECNYVRFISNDRHQFCLMFGYTLVNMKGK